ncbi:hypothetical protein FACS1894200_11620 [Spirochaetia bacterium]|nr:hypothetical protein FACS1894200_11620 [Spirochaetia bacterium]
MKAFAKAYPDRIGPAEYRDGDWAVPIRGVYYYYANGKLLPQSLRSQEADYAPTDIYVYPKDLPQWQKPSAAEVARYKAMTEAREQSTRKRSTFFFSALLRASNRQEAYNRVKQIKLFGKAFMIHYSILEEIALVEEQVLEAAKSNKEVQQWVQSITEIDAWNWRPVAGSGNLSYHSYGIALDILVKTTNTQDTYWQWAKNKYNGNWWDVSYERRTHPPSAVIKIFESYGFIWGGKWLFYDTMHFEYRPEIFILNGLPLNGQH